MRYPVYGGKGRESIVQIQFEYDALSGDVTELSIGSALDSDAVEGMKNIDKIPENSLLIRDLGYFGPKTFKQLIERKLFFISRAKTQWKLYVKNGKN